MTNLFSPNSFPNRYLYILAIAVLLAAIFCSCAPSNKHKTETVVKSDSTRVTESSTASVKKLDLNATIKTVDTASKTDEATFITETEKSFDLVEVDTGTVIIYPKDSKDYFPPEIHTGHGKKLVALPREKTKQTGHTKTQENKGSVKLENTQLKGSDSTASKAKDSTHKKTEAKTAESSKKGGGGFWYVVWVIFKYTWWILLILIVWLVWKYWKQIPSFLKFGL